MKKLLIALLVIGSASSFAGIQCNKLANQELRAAEAVAEYRYNTKTSKEIDSNIRKAHRLILDSADSNFTKAVFDTKCATDLEAVNSALELLSLDIGSGLAQNAIFELLKIKQ